MENCRFVFYNNIGMFWCPFPYVEVNRRIARARKKETNCAIFTDVISMVCTLIEDYSLPISVRESLSYGKKELTGGFKPIKKVALIAGAKRWRGGGRGRGRGEGEREKSAKRENGRERLPSLPNPPSSFHSLQSPTTFDAYHAGY